ncbi:manganese-dependent inorganic pyrophosphatase [Proteiniborus ethanoligenes]|uniref:inorganic diphosphatase n=1 Tax=Proteiniborus ethanoligenes TaxID=415015 RepID=A0A1H3S2J6_9FIRM|nr:putative manganese-dependent inorganic diphosphatase [Proteiniborus ethanoligenes]TAH62710.1 MAG: putative manganese-dependent inorganic diphosphatase [Gottschalkiaceae bacterium]SDZ31997.1 manganese-dependent inorganic pyrophosphatase [Proteiniborus ethanoligenes]
MKETIYITGHKNPDSDSICSALAYAEYKNTNGDVNAIPVRLGEINRETKFILDYFGISEPILLETVRLSVEDLSFDKIAPIRPDISLRMALELMKKNNLNSLPIIDENELLAGIVTISDIMESYIEVWDNGILGKSGTSIDNIIDTLSAKSVLIPNTMKPFKGKICVLAMETKSMSEYIEENDIAICGDRKDVQKLAINKKISLMIVTGNAKVDEEIISLAKEKNITIISTPYDTFTTSRLITQSVPLSHVMTTDNIIAFNLDDLVDNVKEQMAQTRYRSYPVIDDDNNNKVVGLISRYHLISSMKKKVILVDHNERSQSVDGLEECEILEIIDHHRVADVFTGTPIYFRNEPVGSTSTIIASIMFENGRRPSKKMAGILAAAIISDTLLFRSPTSTNTDKIILERLARIADLDVEKFATEMFKAGTSLVGKTPQELLSQDFKTFTIDENKIGIAQVYTMDPDSLKDMKKDLIILMEERAKEHDYSIFILMLTDIFKEASEMIIVGHNKELVAKAFGKTLVSNSFYAPDVLSRKKQVVPPITNILTDIKEL